MIQKTIISLFIMSSLAVTASARVDCLPGYIDQIQVQGNKVLFKLTNRNWALLGTLGKKETEAKYSALLTAFKLDKSITVGYKGQGNSAQSLCYRENYSTPVVMIRINR